LFAVTLIGVRPAFGATLDVCPVGCTYSTIQAAITAAVSGDTITIGAGTYTVVASMAVSKTLTFQGDGSYPKVFYNIGGGASNNIFNVTANNVTFRNIEIYSPTGTFGTRSNYAITFTSGSGLLVDDCKFHDLKRGVYVSGGTAFTVQNSEFSAMNRAMVDIEGGTGPFTVTGNWLYDSSFLGGSTDGILLGNRDNFTGGVAEISYNYIEGVRAAILYTPVNANSPTGGSLLIAHNTVDNTWISTTSYYGANILTPSYNTQGIAIYDPAGRGINSAAVTIRDNIVVNTRWYGTHYNGGAAGVLNGDLSIANSLYWNNYWDAVGSGELPAHYAHEWFGTVADPQIGWQGAGVGVISPNAATKTLDPLFVGGAKTAPKYYYALQADSPANGTASDGTNIGAWPGYVLRYTAGAHGTIAGVSPQTVNYGINGTLVTANPDIGYQFTSWSDGVLTAARTDTNVTGNISVTANFNFANAVPNAPTLVSPVSGSTININTPTLSANYSDPDSGDIGTTNYRISSSSLVDCNNNTNIVASGMSAATADENEDTVWTPGAPIGIDATYYWCAQNNDGALTSSWTGMGNFILDTTGPTLAFTDDVNSGSVESDTIAASWGDATVKKWDYDADGVCSVNAGDYLKTIADSMNQTNQTNNGKYICLYAEDVIGNKSTRASVTAIDILLSHGYVFPSNYSIVINDGAATTPTQSVTVKLSVKNANDYLISNHQDFSGAVWQPLAASPANISWKLTSGDGIKMVYVKFRSSNGEQSSNMHDSIELLTTVVPPPVTPPVTPPIVPEPVIPPGGGEVVPQIILFELENYGGHQQIFNADSPDFRQEAIGNDTVSFRCGAARSPHCLNI
jgi:hypothetical protein